MIYTYISQQSKMRVFDLFSNVGGLFGLFLGMGLLNLVEIIEIFSEVICILFIKNSWMDLELLVLVLMFKINLKSFDFTVWC